MPTERELALKLGISRPSVREALIALEVDGRVDIRVGSGIYILPHVIDTPGPADAAIPIAGPFELLKARALFEGAAAEEAARIATPQDIAALDAAIAAMQAAEHPGPHSMAFDRAFHVAVADILGNDAVTRTISDLFDQRINPYFTQLASYFENADTWEAALREHMQIRDSIAAKDATGARRAMRNHLQNSQKRFSENFGEDMPSSPGAYPKNNHANRRKHPC